MIKNMLAVALFSVPSIAFAGDQESTGSTANSWSGCYFGFGVSRASNDTSTFAAGLYDGGSHSAQGEMGQLRAGCDIQKGQFVFGVMGTVDSGGLGGMNAFFPVGPGFPEYLTTDVEWMSALKARVSVTVSDSLIIYGAAGPAWQKISYTDYDEVPVLSFDGDGSEVRHGYQVGVGAEMKLSERVSVLAEYTYSNFGTEDVTLVDNNPATGYDGSWSNRYSITAQALSVGINFRF